MTTPIIERPDTRETTRREVGIEAKPNRTRFDNATPRDETFAAGVLVRRFLQAAPPEPNPLSSDEGREALFVVEMDGYRYMLTREAVRPLEYLTALPPCRGSSLSPREMEIARLIALGYPNKTIANVLNISVWTVGTHLRRIFDKLGVATHAAMVAALVPPTVPRS